MSSERVTLAMMFGDGYSDDVVQPFVQYLESHGISTIGIPLLEEDESVSYSDITPEHYCQHIDKYIPKHCNNLYLYGISKGCQWLTIYASRRTNVKKLILVEPTTFPGKPEFLTEFEHQRGNDYVEQFYDTPEVDENQDKTDMTLDAIASDRKHYFPKCKTTIVWTTRNNQNQPYSPVVLEMKRKYVGYLRNNGVNVKVHEIDSDHCIDTHDKYFPKLLSIILA